MNCKKAFSLIELAIVLIILGLLVASVSIGNQILQQAQFKKIITNLQDFKVSIEVFDEQHNGLPGDLTNAQSFWPSCANQTSPVTNNCNGNGNGKFEKNYEGMRIWEHLRLAGLLDNKYVGTDTSGNGNQFNPGNNAPKLPTGNGCYFASSESSSATWYSLTSDQVIILGGTATNSSCDEGSFTPKQAYYLDFKIDDGKAETGKILSTEGESIKTSNPNDCSNGDYNLAIETETCRTLFNVL